ncbi:MAG: hypothetical protein ABJA57_02335 [Ginsengibacter sp.]
MISSKKILTLICLSVSFYAKAQKIENIFVNLYTDSLKKGTYNYINVDGLLADKTYTPLDTTEIIFWASDGRFYGNMLFVEKDFKKEKISIKVTLKKNPSVSKEFTMAIKKKEDDEKLKTADEILRDMKESKSKTKNKRKLKR